MIYLNPRGGLGNRLRVISSAIKLGMDYDDSIIVFWRKGSELGCSFEELFENIIYNNSKGKLIIKSVNCSEEKLVQKITEEIGNKRSYIDTNRELKRFQEDYINNNGAGDFLLSTCSSFYNFSGEYDWLLPKKEIADKIEYIVNKFGDQCIGIHIRRTDHEISKKFSPKELFVQIINDEIKRSSDVKFYLATDDLATKIYFLDLFKEKIVTNESQFFTRKSKNGIESAVIDLYALSKTKKIYGSYWSSFSAAAASIGNIKLEVVHKKPMEELLNKKIVIYGAGSLGRVVYQIYSELCEIVGWVDQNYKIISDRLGMKILPPNMIPQLSFDFIIIAVWKYDIKMEIKQLLLNMNIDSYMIVEEV